MKRIKLIKTPLWMCYCSGVRDRWFNHTFRVADSSFVAKRQASFTEVSARAMNELESEVKEIRKQAEILISELEEIAETGGEGMSKVRARRRQASARAELIGYDASITTAKLAAREKILPYAKRLSAQTASYLNGLHDRTSEASYYMLEADAVFADYEATNSAIDNYIHSKVKRFIKI